jgi:hypothetical protein
MRVASACAAALVALGWLGWESAAHAGDPSIAREQVKIGYALAEEGRCEEAVPHLLESLRLDARAIALINLADCEEKLGRLGLAMGHWVEARTRAESEGARAIEKEATRRALELEPRLPRLTVVLAPSAPADAVVERDGVVLGAPSVGVALPIDPGWHVITVWARGRTPATMTIALVEREATSVEVAPGAPLAPVPSPLMSAPLKLPPRSPARSLPPVAIGLTAAVIGVALGVTGILLGER